MTQKPHEAHRAQPVTTEKETHINQTNRAMAQEQAVAHKEVDKQFSLRFASVPSVIGHGSLVTGTLFCVLGPWYLVLGAWFGGRGTSYLVLGAWSLVLCTRCLAMLCFIMVFQLSTPRSPEACETLNPNPAGPPPFGGRSCLVMVYGFAGFTASLHRPGKKRLSGRCFP